MLFFILSPKKYIVTKTLQTRLSMLTVSPKVNLQTIINNIKIAIIKIETEINHIKKLTKSDITSWLFLTHY